MRRARCCFAAALILQAFLGRGACGELGEPSQRIFAQGQFPTIQTAPLDPTRPLYVATHPRVTTTVRFPSPMGPPEGRGFTEDEAKHPGEYLVSWTPGESHFTVTPLASAGALNLNVPYQGSTYVVYFYPAPRQLDAVASLVLTAAPAAGTAVEPRRGEAVEGEGGPARLVGFIDRLRLIRAAPDPAALARIASAMGLRAREASGPGPAAPPAEATRHEVRLLRIVRDPRAGFLGFCLRVRNKTGEPQALNVSSFKAHAAAAVLTQAAVDCPRILGPGEEVDAFLVVACPPLEPYSEMNEWRVSADLLIPGEAQGKAVGQGP
jgi:hypothetical protein